MNFYRIDRQKLNQHLKTKLREILQMTASALWSMTRAEKEGWLAFLMDFIYLVIFTPVFLSRCWKEKKTLVNTSGRLLYRFGLSSASFSTGCHSPLAAQTHLTPPGDSYSLSDFQLSVEGKALSGVHCEGFWQDSMVCFHRGLSAEIGDLDWRGRRKAGGGGRGGGGAVERPSDENRVRSGNHQTAVG